MSRIRIYTRNLLANWVGYIANLVVAFCLAPLVVHTLGKGTYGVWVVLSSVTGYLGLVEMGTQAGLGRYVNFYLGRNEIDKVNGILNTALAFFMAVGVVLLLAAGGVGLAFGTLFPKVPAELLPVARPALMLVALNLWLSFLGTSFSLVLTSFERFDISNAINLVVLGIRTVGTIVVLKAGGGIVSLALVQVVSSVVGVVGAWLSARVIFAEMRLHPTRISLRRFKELFAFSIWSFLSQVAMRLMYLTDEIVILILLGAEQVTFYALPLMLINYGRGLVDHMAGVVGPQTIKASSVGNLGELRTILGWGSKILMYVTIPLFVGMIFYGEEFFVLWQGPDFRISGSVLILLAIPQLFVMGVRPTVSIIKGLGYVRFGALITLAQGLANLGLTLLFVMGMGMGLYGVALGTLVPAVIFNCVVVAFVLRWIRYPGAWFVGNNVVRWAVMAALFCGVCLAVNLLPGKEAWGWFALKVVGLILISFAAGWYVIFSGGERAKLRGKLADLFGGRKQDPTGPADVQ